MKKFVWILCVILTGILILTGCGSVETEVDETVEETEDTGVYNTVDLASQYDSLLEKVKNNLITSTYHNDEYDLDIPYGIYVPEDYSEDKDYPLVMFIPDSTLAGKDVEAILEQGYGGVVWADDSVQTGNPALILYPAYPEVTVDDHNGYTISDYVPATIGLIETVQSDYSIDNSRIYTTGQSMGCMTSMILASDNPDLFAACMFVDGQWDPTTLAPLADQTFCYFAAVDDTSAYNGMQAAIPVWEENGAKIVQASWNAEATHDEIQSDAQDLVKEDSKIYCITWESGTIEAKQMGGGFGGPGGNSGGGPKGDNPNGTSQGNGPGASVGVHMASFDYAYNVNTMIGWILVQHK